MMQVMLDLETLGLTERAAIISIGAVSFDFDKPEDTFDGQFEASITVQSNMDANRKIEAPTLQWWMAQPHEARSELKFDRELTPALLDFRAWFRAQGDDSNLWANGATFDIPIIEHAMRTAVIEIPWKFYQHRCFRTMRAAFPGVERVEPAIKHSALHDAMAQAITLRRIMARL